MSVKSYATIKGVHAAVRRLGMQAMNYDAVVYDAAGSKGYTALFIVDNREDFDEIWGRGFKARMEKEDAQ
ncbi:hypothetical protein RPALISO_217 [Ruegeria phage RpAliso]|nr:hypothetical protein RPALISO_217 [Ruegeria phage RpAliso]